MNIGEIKSRYISEIKNINIDGADIEGLLDFLDKHNVYTSPSTSKYSCSFEGGLMAHSLTTLDTLTMLNKQLELHIDENSIRVVALLGEIFKANLYEKAIVNKKVYSSSGSKYDKLGNYDWESVEEYKVKDQSSIINSNMYYGGNQFSSLMMIQKFIPLSKMETLAIMYQSCNSDSASDPLVGIMASNPLVVLLHCSQLISSYIVEKRYE